MAVAIVMLSGTASAKEAPGCVTDKCHPTMGKAKWVHGPVGAGMCIVCHRQPDPKRHQFKLVSEKSELCFACHERSRDMMLQEHLHKPVADGKCTACHDPHQSDNRYMLKGRAAELCYQCHKKDAFNGAHVHGPVGAGDCNACHNPHASAFPNQLVADPKKLCFQCHEEQGGIPGRRHQHSPVSEACTKCHRAHASTAPYLLPKEASALCVDCHPKSTEFASASVSHPPVAAGDCRKCHDVHGSDYPKLSPMPATELCFKCHSALGEYVRGQAFAHGPLRDGDCNACHDPHGSTHYRILRKDFPKEFYVPYAEANYDMCFACHNRQVAQEERTTTLTDFRDQNRNLHFLHVNKQEKGRSCRACHQVHASSQPKHIRTSVPFGKMDWELPVTYTKTKNGGSCNVGCHAPKAYAR